MTCKRPLFVGLCLALFLSGQVALTWAQSANLQQTINLATGESLYVISEHDNSQQISWILTRGGDFVQAERLPRFAFRSATAEQLLLTGEVSADEMAPRRAQITVLVSEGPTRFTAPPSSSTAQIFNTEPSQAGNQVNLNTTQLLKLSPGRDDIAQLFLDTNLKSDGNKNGDAADDNALKGSDANQGKTPIYIWFAEGKPVEMIAAAKLNDGQIISQRIMVNFGQVDTTEPDPDTTTPTSGDIEVQELGAGKVRLAAKGDFGGQPVLMRWDFGDGEQSLLDMPVHTYQETGTYQVKVTANDLQTGQPVGTFSHQLSITVPVTIQPDNGGTVTPRPDKPNTTTPSSGDGGGLIWKIGLLLLAVMTAAGIGILAMFVISKLRSRSLQETIAEVEDKQFPQAEEAGDQVTNPPPMTLPEVEVVDTKEPEQEDGPGPSWLAPSEEAATEAAPAEVVTPVAEPVIETPPPAAEPVVPAAEPVVEATPPPASEPIPPTPTTPTEPATEAGPVPEWLQTTSEPSPTPPVESTPQEAAPAQEESGADRIPPDVWEAMTPEEREQERKRRKRQRYRANKRERESGAEPTAAPEVTDAGPVPEWLQPQTDTPASTPEPAATPSDDDVQFTVSADSLGTTEAEVPPTIDPEDPGPEPELPINPAGPIEPENHPQY